MRSKSIGKYFDGFFDAFRAKATYIEFKTAAQIVIEFGHYMDMLAASNPHMYHHVYEWNMVGQPEGRLFEFLTTPISDGVFISYFFIDSKVPNRNGQVFARKAEVMESGKMVTNNPEGPVPLYNGEMFRVGPFTFKPGGEATTGAFAEAFRLWFGTRSNLIASSTLKTRPSTLSYGEGFLDGGRIIDSIHIK